jgi:hyperosmotically inducible periplasmic protein
MMRWISHILFAALLTIGLSAPARAQDLSNLEVFNGVSNAVQRYTRFTIFDSVRVGVDNGVVILTGKVTMPYKATDIEKRVAAVTGVTRVVNQIDVLPVSLYDDQLRVRIARAIYSHPALFNYGLGPTPSIHIVVERGHLTLEGVVNNNMDRQIARSVVGFFGTFSIVNDLKTDEEVEQALEQL